VNAPRLRALTASLARGCDACVATSEELANDLRSLGADVMVVPHGVDSDRFAEDRLAPAADLAGFEQPLVGYVGLLDDHLAFDSIRAVADSLERGTVVLVGAANTDVSALEHPRIVRLGFRPYETIPAYLAAFNCCILPFKANSLTNAVDPIKLREYLAAGRPVVSAQLPAVAKYSDVVELAGEAQAFSAAVTRLLDPAHDSPSARARRRQRVATESWDAVAQQIRPILESLLERSRA
jgi:glycosyltransferase involved in cell wall biosynthesis